MASISTGASPPENYMIRHYSSEVLRRLLMMSAQELAIRNDMSPAEVFETLAVDAKTAEA